MAGGFFEALFAVAFGEIGRRLSRRQFAHELASSRPWAWDAQIVGGVIAIYDPLPTTGRADVAYAEVTSLLFDDSDPDVWGDAVALEAVLVRELGRRARGEDVSASAIHAIAKRLSYEYRHFRQRAGAGTY